MSEEFLVSTMLTAKEVNESDHQVMAMNTGLETFGLAKDVVEARSAILLKYEDGRTEYRTIDFNRNRADQLIARNQQLDDSIYNNLCSSFDRMAGRIYETEQQVIEAPTE